MNTNHPNSIPFLDLVTPHVELERELTDVFQRALRSAGFIGGPMVEEFEKAFAAFCHTKHSVAVNSGTDALRFALMAVGVRQGDVRAALWAYNPSRAYARKVLAEARRYQAGGGR